MKNLLNCIFKIVFGRMLIVIFVVILQVWVLWIGFRHLGSLFPFMWEGMSILGAFLIIYIINKDVPTEFKLAWIMPICLFPVLGAFIYLFVESNPGEWGLKLKVRRRAKQTKYLLETTAQTQAAIAQCSKQFQGFAYYMQNTAGFPVYHNFSAKYFPLGEDKLTDLLAELKKAKSYIFLEYFIIQRGTMWNAVLEILKQKAREGIEVRVMYDGMCSILLLPYQYPKELHRYGIKAKMFAPILPFLSTTQNNRDHRKIVVIDGKTAFTGGINLSDEYINEVQRFGHWKDTAVKIIGDAVWSFTVMFLQMWNLSEQKQEDYGKYLPSLPQMLPQKAYADHNGFSIPYADTPTRRAEVAKTVYESVLNGASSYVHFMTPYFVVDRQFLDTMRYAAQRGVEVSMIIPHRPDKKIVYYIARTFYPELLQAGIRVFEYLPGFIHAKVVTADDQTAVIGTVNLDYRSFYHHFECGAYFYKGTVAREAERDFQKTMGKSLEVTREYYKQIPIYQKLLGRVFRLVAPLL